MVYLVYDKNTKGKTKMRSLVSLFFLATVSYLSITLLLKVPLVWPDEPAYADVALNLAQESRLGTNLSKGVVPGIEEHAFWYPPVLFYSLAFWFKLFGFSLLNQRLFSLFLSFVLLLTLYLLSKKFLDEKLYPIKVLPWLIALPPLALAADFTFFQASHVSRPEMLVLTLGTGSLYLFLRSEEKGLGPRVKKSYTISSALLASLAFLTHTIGSLFLISLITYLFISRKRQLLKLKAFYLFLVVALLPILFWLISIFPYFDIFRHQWELATLRKNLEASWILMLFQSQPLPLQIIYLCYMLVSLIFLFFSVVKKGRYLPLGIILILAWIFAIYGKMFWYFVLPLPFIYLSLVILIAETLILHEQLGKQVVILIAGLLFTMLFFNLLLIYQNFSERDGERYSYDKFSNEVLRYIPESKTVFLSSIPDAYYGLKLRGKNNLFEFPALPTSQENYLQMLSNSDFVVYNGSFEQVLFGSFLNSYLEKNTFRLVKISQPNQYQAFIIELKPQDQRAAP